MGLDVETLEQSLRAIRAFASRNLSGAGVAERDGAGRSSDLRSLWEDGLDLRLLFLPPSAGGMGGDALDTYRVCETIGSVDLELGTLIPDLAVPKQDGQTAGLAPLMVAGLCLGAGWSALERAILRSKEIPRGNSTLSRDAEFTHQLVVRPAAGLEAARAAIEDAAGHLDAGHRPAATSMTSTGPRITSTGRPASARGEPERRSGDLAYPDALSDGPRSLRRR